MTHYHEDVVARFRVNEPAWERGHREYCEETGLPYVPPAELPAGPECFLLHYITPRLRRVSTRCDEATVIDRLRSNAYRRIPTDVYEVHPVTGEQLYDSRAGGVEQDAGGRWVWWLGMGEGER